MKHIIGCLICIIQIGLQQVPAQSTLQYFIQEAYKNNPVIKTNQIQTQANQLENEKILTTLTKPVIATELNYLISPIINTDNNQTKFQLNPSKNTNSYYGYDLSAYNGGLYSAVVTLNHPLFNNKRIQLANEQLAIQNKIIENSSKLNLHDIEHLITEQYIIALQDLNMQKAYSEIASIIAEQRNITEKLAQQALKKQSDYKLLDIEYKNFKNLYQVAIQNYATHLLALKSAAGISDTSIYPIEDFQQNTIETSTEASGFTQQYVLDSLNLSVAQKNFNLKYKPLVSLYASGGLNAIYAPTLFNRFGVMAGIKFSTTIFDGRQKELNNKKTAIQQQATSININYFQQQNETRKESILKQINSIDEQIHSNQLQLKSYKELLEYYKTQIMNGQISVIDYITVLRSSASLQLNLIMLNSTKAIAINNYNYWNW